MKFSKAVVRYRVAILILTIILIFPSIWGISQTRVNYDMLTYLPKDIETVIGQNELMEDFNKGAFSFIILENMDEKDVAGLEEKIKDVEHVDTVIWYDSFSDLSVPIEILPDSITEQFNTKSATMMAVFFDTSTSDNQTMEAVKEIRSICGEQCFVSGMTALVVDLKELCEKEEPVYVGLAVLLALIAMLALLDSWLIPFVFLLSIGAMIVINLGTNIFLGEISYITKALSAVLQLAVTMDYSIFLWHSYNEQLHTSADKYDAMSNAIKETLSSVLGSSITTIAGFISLCFMSFTLGKDLGLVMAKGVLLGVIGCVTVLPSLILVLDKPLQKTMHKTLIPDMKRLSDGIIKRFPILIIIFVLSIAPAYYGYSRANEEVYYDMGNSLPEDMNYVISNTKLSEEFDIASTHMILVDKSMSKIDVKNMVSEIKQLDGVKTVLSLDDAIGSRVPEEMIPESVTSALKGGKWQLILVNSQYKVASDEVNDQVDEINSIVKAYDDSGMIIGEAPCMKDMIEITGHDFAVVTSISIIAIFIIILLVEKSITLPFILILVIEIGIFINLGLPHYLGQSMAFITPICISTIQLGATVDYAILLTTRYKANRISGMDKKSGIREALYNSIPSIIVSGVGLFAATFGVAIYSDIEIISSMCMLMARGAIISMMMVIFILPAMLMVFDSIILRTTSGMKNIVKSETGGVSNEGV